MIDLAIQFGEANEKVFGSSLLPPQKKEIIKETFICTHRLREAVADGFFYWGHAATLIFH